MHCYSSKRKPVRFPTNRLVKLRSDPVLSLVQSLWWPQIRPGAKPKCSQDLSGTQQTRGLALLWSPEARGSARWQSSGACSLSLDTGQRGPPRLLRVGLPLPVWPSCLQGPPNHHSLRWAPWKTHGAGGRRG